MLYALYYVSILNIKLKIQSIKEIVTDQMHISSCFDKENKNCFGTQINRISKKHLAIVNLNTTRREN